MNLNGKPIFLTSQSPILPWNTGKHMQMTAEDSKGMSDAGTSNVSHVSISPYNA